MDNLIDSGETNNEENSSDSDQQSSRRGVKRKLHHFENSSIEIQSEHEEHNQKFNIETKRYSVLLNFNAHDFYSANEEIEKFLNAIHTKLVSTLEEGDKISTLIDHHSLDIPISIPFMSIKDFTIDVLANAFIRVAQSKRGLKIGKLEILFY